MLQLCGRDEGCGVVALPIPQGPGWHGGHFGIIWGRDMTDKPRTAEPIYGPHHLGKQGSVGRCPWWSRRLRDGIGKRDQPEPSIVSEATNGWALELPKLQSSALQKSGAAIMMERQANKSGKRKKKKRKRPHDKTKKRQKASMSPSIVRITSRSSMQIDKWHDIIVNSQHRIEHSPLLRLRQQCGSNSFHIGRPRKC